MRCRHPHANGQGGPCPGTPEGLERWNCGYRCRKCAGMHHFDGTRKTIESIKTCGLGCCKMIRPEVGS